MEDQDFHVVSEKVEKTGYKNVHSPVYGSGVIRRLWQNGHG